MNKKEVNNLPVGWTMLSISELLAPLDDGRILHQGWSPRCEKEPSDSELEWGVLKTTSIQSGMFMPEYNKRLPGHLDPRPNLEVKPGDILLTCAGPRSRCGIACLVRNTCRRLMISGKMYRFRPDVNRIDPRYLEAYLLSTTAQVAIDEMKTGGNESGLNLTHARFRKLQVPVAPLNQQKRIVVEIEKQFSRLDDAIANLKRVKANLKRYKAAVLKAAVEGRLVETEAELARREGRDYETGEQHLQRILQTRRSQWQGKGKYKEPSISDTTDLPELSEGWVYATAEQLTDGNRAITYGVIKLGEAVEDGVAVLRSSDVRQLHVDLKDVKRISPKIAANYKRTFLKGGEVLMTVRGTLGGVAVVPPHCDGFNVSREVAMLALVDSKMAHLVSFFIASTPLENWLMQRAKGIAYTGINIETLKALPIPIPPISEQQRIFIEIDRRLSIVAEIETQVDVNLRRADRLRQSILERAFSGSLIDIGEVA